MIALVRRRRARGTSPSAAGRVATLREYATDTWQSFVVMTRPGRPGCRADNISVDRRTRRASRRRPTSAAYLWATMSARDLGIISAGEATDADAAGRSTTVPRLERHEPSGQFYNWYDPQTGAKLTDLAGRRLARVPVPVQRRQRLARRRASDGDERRPAATRRGPGDLRRDGLRLLLRPGRRPASAAASGTSRRPAAALGNYRGGPDVYYTCHHYGALQHRAADRQLHRHRRRARSRRRTTSRCGAPSRRPATGAGRR